MDLSKYTDQSQPKIKPEDTVILFGKHKGKTLRDILTDDASYLDWLNGTDLNNIRLKDAVQRMCVTYSAEIDRAIDDSKRERFRR